MASGCETAPTVGLKVTLEFDSDSAPESQTTFDLAAGEAQGAILFGENIFYQLCDDVSEPDEPEGQIDERWELVEGQITLAKAIPSDEGGVGPVSASSPRSQVVTYSN